MLSPMKSPISFFAPLALAALAAAVSGACGGQQPTVVNPTPIASAKPTASTSQVVPPLGTDTSAVPEPKNLLVSGRVASLGRALKSVHTWSQLPMPKDDAVTELLTTEAVGGLVDLEQPIDFAVAVAGSGTRLKEQIAVSAAIKDFEKAKVAFLEHFKLTLDGGMLHVDGLGRAAAAGDDDDDDAPAKGEKPKDDESEDRRHCALAPAFGAAPVRLVCGWSLGALRTLGPYLTRNATRTSTTSDVTVQLRTSPVKQLISDQKSMVRGLVSTMLGMRGLNRGMSDVAGSLGMDLADLALDLDGATLDAKLDDAGANLTLAAKFGGQSAALTKLAMQHPERTDVAPASFWQLPGDSELAVFYRGLDKPELDGARDLFANVIGSQLSGDGVTDPERAAIVDAFKKMTSGAAAVFGAGLDTPKVRRAFADQRTADRFSRTSAPDAARVEARRAAAEAVLGWSVFGIDEAAAKFAGAARDLVTAFGKPKVTTAFKTKRKDGPVPAMRIGATPKGMPKDTLHLEVDLYPYVAPPSSTPAKPSATPKPGDKPQPPKPAVDKPIAKDDGAKAPKPLRIHMLIVPDGAARTWIVLSADESTATAKATAVLAASPDSDKLVRREGLDALKTGKIGAGGFFTQRGWPTLQHRLGAISGSFTGIGEHYDDATAAQHGGTTPILFGFTAQQSGPFTATVQLPRAAIEDFVVSFIKKITGG